MGTNSKPVRKELNWRKRLALCALVAVVAYAYGEPYLDEWTGWDWPAIRDQGNVATVEKDSDNSKTPDSQANVAKANSGANRTHPYLTPMGRKSRLESPAGLIYGIGGGGEHRLDHVLHHAQDNPSRPEHSVFEGSELEILKIIDEAYTLVKSKSKRVQSKPDDRLHFRMEHIIDMQQKIGYLGGKKGLRKNFPSRSKLTLILDNGKFVVTAYPDK